MNRKYFACVLLVSISALILSGAALAQDEGDAVITPANAANLQQIAQIGDQDQSISDDSITFSPDSTLLAYVQDGEIQMWDFTADETVLTIPGMSFPVWLAFIDDGDTLLAVTTSFLREISSWDVATGEERPAVELVEEISTSTTNVSPDGTLAVASLFEDEMLRLIDTVTGETITDLPTKAGLVAISPDNQTVAIGDNNTKMELWDVATAEVRLTLESPSRAYGNPVFSMDGTLVAACNVNDGVDIWEAESGELVQSMPNATCGRGAFSPNSDLFVTGFFSMSIYDVATGEALFMVDEASNAVFSPDGRFLAAVSGFSGTLTLWAAPG